MKSRLGGGRFKGSPTLNMQSVKTSRYPIGPILTTPPQTNLSLYTPIGTTRPKATKEKRIEWKKQFQSETEACLTYTGSFPPTSLSPLDKIRASALKTPTTSLRLPFIYHYSPQKRKRGEKKETIK